MMSQELAATAARVQTVAGTVFDYQPRTRLVFGPGSIERIGELAAELGAKTVLLVTDAGIVASGHAGRVTDLLDRSSIEVVTFADVQENPSTACVRKCLEVALRAEVDLIIGLGGGSSMDTAKGCNFILTNGGEMKDYWGIGKARHPMLPLIAIPTTAGTGSECQSFALISDEVTHRKMACGDPKAAARIALLDPVLTLSQPPRVTACTGIDAMAHAVETAVTRKRNPLSFLFSREAFRLTAKALPRVLQAPDDLDARGRMALGAAWAGTAIENSMLGAAHSAANPLTAKFGVVHGNAVGVMLPHVVRFNSAERETAKIYSELSAGANIPDLPDFLAGMLQLADLPGSLKECGISLKEIPDLAAQAAREWTATFNPRPVTADDFESLYLAAYEAR